MDARGLSEGELFAGIRPSTLGQLAEWTVQTDKVIVF